MRPHPRLDPAPALIAVLTGLGLAALPVRAATAQAATTPTVAGLTAVQPGADGAVRYLPAEAVRAAFAKGVPMVEVGDYKIHASRREAAGLVEVHTRDTDIAYVLEGSATLVTGATAVGLKPTGAEEWRGTAIEGGRTRELKPGDVVVIPNGTPHWFKRATNPFLYYVVKVRQAERPSSSGAM